MGMAHDVRPAMTNSMARIADIKQKVIEYIDRYFAGVESAANLCA
jgi:hypothetical protein